MPYFFANLTAAFYECNLTVKIVRNYNKRKWFYGGEVMANCCVCGEKLGFMSGAELSKGNSDLKICERCKVHKDNFCKIQDEMSFRRNVSAREYFGKYIQEGIVLSDAKEIIEKMIEDSIADGASYEKEAKIRKEKEEQEAAYYEEVKKTIEERKYNFKVTTGYNFEKYNIVDYLDIVSGEVVLGTGFFSELGAQISDTFGTSSGMFEGKLSVAKKAALENIKAKALVKGANAIIGIDFDIMTFSNNMIAVSANGTAVVIEKIEG